MHILGIAGFSGAGKTTLVTKLIPVLRDRGMTVSTIKHAHHAFDVDTPGKDSYEHRHAGAQEVLVSSGNRWALMHENRGDPEPGLDALLAKLSPVDLVLVEGWKHGGHKKLEVYRPSIGKPLLAVEDAHVIAVATDGAKEGNGLDAVSVPLIDIDDLHAIADFVQAYCAAESPV